MFLGYRYIDVDENGRIEGSRMTPLETSIDTEGMTVPEMPTDAVYDLYYHAEQGLHWVKVVDFEPDPPLTEQEQAIMDTAINTEYLVCLADMGL